MKTTIILFIALMSVFLPCKSKKYYYDFFKIKQGIHYLCYIESEPEIIDLSTSDSLILINELDNKYKNPENKYFKTFENYDMMMFDIKIVDVFMSRKAYDFWTYVNDGKEQVLPSKDLYLNDYEKIYILLIKKQQSSKKIKKYVKRSFKQKKLILLTPDNFGSSNSKVFVCSPPYVKDERMCFDNLIKLE